ncbi:PREDICTED: putative gustatory receptor 39b [Nicrophorus vespilloides]|uniref:Gustatory receptor n=1 Tax=Nicrophorus vespilloides TaxID=110193 RepID=A0ABM1MN79_NICVS|nr:PREDICTED: putative gustatory receptor 39b [Nicrophorus vespilloides]
MPYNRAFYTLANYLGIVPEYDALRGKPSSPCNRIYRFALFAFTVVGSVYNVYGDFAYRFPNLQTNVIVLNCLFKFGTYFICTSTILGALLWNQEKYKDFFRIMNSVDQRLYMKSNKESMNLETATINILMITVIVLEIYVQVSIHGVNLLQYSIYEYFQSLFMTISCLVQYNFLLSVVIRLNHLNVLLEKKLQVVGNEVEHTKKKYKWFTDRSIETAPQIYTSITELIDIFNNIFGWKIFYTTIRTIVQILLSMNNIIIYGIEKSTIMSDYKYFNIAVYVLWLMMEIIYCVILASGANKILDKSQETLLISYKILCLLPVETNCNERTNLNFLVQEISFRPLILSAAGFFTIDYTMVLTIITSVASYLIVVIQFN